MNNESWFTSSYLFKQFVANMEYRQPIYVYLFSFYGPFFLAYIHNSYDNTFFIGRTVLTMNHIASFCHKADDNPDAYIQNYLPFIIKHVNEYGKMYKLPKLNINEVKTFIKCSEELVNADF